MKTKFAAISHKRISGGIARSDYFSKAICALVSAAMIIFIALNVFIMYNCTKSRLPDWFGVCYFLNTSQNVSDFSNGDLLRVEKTDVENLIKGSAVVVREGRGFSVARVSGIIEKSDGSIKIIIGYDNLEGAVRVVSPDSVSGAVTGVNRTAGNIISALVRYRQTTITICMLLLFYEIITLAIEISRSGDKNSKLK